MTKILVIEDDWTVREAIQCLLEGEGFQALEAPDGYTGIRLAKEYLPDLILCDVQMAGINGYEVLETLQRHPPTTTIPFIFLTARGTKAELRQGMELGADDYLIKPCEVNELLRTIARRLNKKALVKSQAEQKLDELRSSIALSLPHEFRTPITGILSSVELLRMYIDENDKATILDLADHIQSSTERLYQLVKNFLLYSELEIIAQDPKRQGVALDGMTFNASEVIGETSSQIARQVRREADLQLDLKNAVVLIEQTNLQKVISELVANAFKFSGANTPVHVSSRVERETFTIAVSNYGRGMTAEQIASVGGYLQFDRKSYEQQGSGLGLAIAKRLVELHGGQLEIDSIPDQKTIVRVTLPCSTETLG